METSNLLAFILSVHLVSGVVSLLVALPAMLSRKGSTRHRTWGKVYFTALTLVAFTSVIRTIYLPNPFLVIISAFSFFLAANGYRAVFLKGLHKDQQVDLVDWFINVVFGIVCFGILYWGVSQQSMGYIVLSLFMGICGLSFVIARLYSFIVRPKQRHHWLYVHLVMMLSSYVLNFTAFSIVNFDFFEVPGIVKWLWAIILGAPLIYVWLLQYQRRLSEKN